MARRSTTKPAAEAAKDQAPAATPAPKPLVVEVTGPRRGRRRAGRFFTAEPTIIPLADLGEEDKAALIADPLLAVTTREAD